MYLRHNAGLRAGFHGFGMLTEADIANIVNDALQKSGVAPAGAVAAEQAAQQAASWADAMFTDEEKAADPGEYDAVIKAAAAAGAQAAGAAAAGGAPPAEAIAVGAQAGAAQAQTVKASGGTGGGAGVAVAAAVGIAALFLLMK